MVFCNSNSSTISNNHCEQPIAGTIRYITLENWMAYTGPVTLYPSSGLNIIAASNGSGKSAIVCALALGLGYSPSIISRGDTPSVFVKRGCNWAKIDIGINCCDNNALTISRRIDLDENGESKSTWSINGKKATHMAVCDTISKLNIRLDNFISFLPQENIGKFASMTPKQLLSATLKGINPNLLDGQQDIEKLDKDIELCDSRIKANLKQLSILKGEIDLLERKEEEHMQLRDEKIKLSFLNHILFLIQLEDLSGKIENSHNKIGVYESEINGLKLKMESLSVMKKKILQAYQKYDSESYELEKTITDIVNGLSKPNELFSSKSHFDLYNNVLTFKKRLESDELKKMDMQRRLDELVQIDAENKKEIQLLQDRILESETKFYQLSSLLAEKKVEFDNLIKQSQANSFSGKYSKNVLEGKAKKIKLSIYPQLDMLQRIQLDKLYTTLHPMSIENVEKFLHVQNLYPNVLGPVASLIQLYTNKNNSSSVQYASILECVLKNYLDAFVAPNTLETVENLSHKYHLSIITIPKKKIPLCYVTQEIRDWGIDTFLHETFQAPEDVKQTLSNIAHINQSFIIGDSSRLNDSNFHDFYNFMIEEISRQIGKRVKTLEFFMNGMRRRYTQLEGNSFVDEQTPFPSMPKVLTVADEISNLTISELTREIDNIKEELDKNSYRRDSVRLQRLEVLSKKVERDCPDLIARLKSLPATDLRSSLRNQLSKAKRLFEEDVIGNVDRLEKSIKKLDKVKTSIEKFKVARTKMSYLNKLLSQLDNVLRPLTETVEAKEKLIDDTRKLLVEFVEKKENLESQIRESKQILENMISNSGNKNLSNNCNEVHHSEKMLDDFLKDYRGKYRGKDEILKQIQISQVKIQHLSSLIDTSGSDETQINYMMDSLEAKRSQSANIEKNIKFDEQNKKAFLAKRSELTELWVNEVKEIVANIDSKFSYFMSLVKDGVMGKVRFISKDKISEAEISIRVRFSEMKDLLPLSASYQSGGERGVVTMLYILSLQHYTFSPFYLLDEINQGLDVDYERAILRIIQSNLKKDSQLFIITPHLIPGLDLSQATMHFPFNGPFITDNGEGWAL